MKHIASAFVKAQQAFGPALKTSSNPHFKSKYADLANVVEAVIDALNNNGIAMIQGTHEDATGVTVETMFIHESGETLSSGKLHVPAAKQDPQGYGSALTYARRYSLMAACGIAPEDDDGNAASKAPQQKAPRMTDKQVSILADLINSTESDLGAILAYISKGAGETIKALKDAPQSAYKPVYDKLAAKKKDHQQEDAMGVEGLNQ